MRDYNTIVILLQYPASNAADITKERSDYVRFSLNVLTMYVQPVVSIDNYIMLSLALPFVLLAHPIGVLVLKN